MSKNTGSVVPEGYGDIPEEDRKKAARFSSTPTPSLPPANMIMPSK